MVKHSNPRYQEAVERESRKHYDGQFTIINAEDLRDVVFCDAAYFHNDVRPFRVVMRYLEQMGYQPALSETGSPLIAYKRGGKTILRNISMAKMLYICKEKSREAQNNAKTSFAKMCAEEDEDELDMILEWLRQHQPGTISRTIITRSEDTDKVIPFIRRGEDEEGEGSETKLARTVPNKTQEWREEIPPYMMF